MHLFLVEPSQKVVNRNIPRETFACSKELGMVTRRGGRSFSLSDSDHSEGEQSLLTLNAPRRQSLGFGVTHCPLPYVQEEEEEDEEEEDEGVPEGETSRCESDQADVREEGCWAWLVVFSSFICLCVLDGVSYTFGMFLQPLTDDLDIGLGAASMVGSLQVGRLSYKRAWFS